MREPTTELEKQIDAACHYRGNVTVAFTDGTAVEAFLFNRDFGHPKLKEAPFVELLKKGGAREKVAITRLESVTLSGADHAEVFVKGQEQVKNKAKDDAEA